MSSSPLYLVHGEEPRGLEDLVRPEFRVASYRAKKSDPVLFGPACSVQGCDGSYVPNKPNSFCRNHMKRAKRLGLRPEELLRLPVQELRTYPNVALFDFRELQGRLRLEIQFALQERHDLMEARLAVSAFNGGRNTHGIQWVGTISPDASERSG